MRARLVVLAATLALPIVAACAAKEEPPSRTPQQQRTVDSTIGASALPGAGGVRGALAAQDSAKAMQARRDSIAMAP